MDVVGEAPIALRTRRGESSDPNGVFDNGVASRDDLIADVSADSASITPLRRIIVVVQLSGVNLITSVINGLVTIGLPRIASDLGLAEELFFWPASVYGLTTGSTLLLAGSIADIIGPRSVDLVGSFFLAFFILGCGFAQTGTQLIVFRAIQGIALALHLSASVGLVTDCFPRGRGRNLAFSCLGLSQPLGFSIGLVVGGIMIDTIGWRSGWYICGGSTFVLSLIGLWVLPSLSSRERGSVLHKLIKKIDWVGVAISSAFMAALSYFLAIISTDINNIHDGKSIALLTVCGATLPAFIYWVHRQVKLQRPALIPNKIWKNLPFSTICFIVLLSYGVLQSMEQYSSLFFQEVQELPPFQASIRILPSLVVGTALNLTTGLLVDRFAAVYLVAVSSILCAIAPLLMALANPDLPYWYNAFFAQLLGPISGDILFTVGLIVVSEVFSEDTQSLAGAVFNTASQFGTSIGLAIMQVISTVTSKNFASSVPHTEALLSGYRASFWTMFGLMMTCFVFGTVGLRKAGKVGAKRD